MVKRRAHTVYTNKHGTRRDGQETQVPKYWREEHLPTEYVRDQCAFLDEWVGWLLERDILPELTGWQDRLTIAIRNQRHDVAELVHRLTETISTSVVMY